MNSITMKKNSSFQQAASIRSTQTMTIVAGTIYYQGKSTAKFACMLGSVTMAVVSALTNYWILLPLFESFMPLDALIESFTAFIPFIHTKLDVVLWNTIPFNLLKGLGISIVTLLIIPKLTPVLRGKIQ